MFNEKKFLEMVLQTEAGIRNDSLLPPCNCLPPCNSVSYNVDVRSADSDGKTVVMVYFKESEFIALERQELFGDVNFWANCGGLVGLFIGFSIMSFVEILYYLFFRWMYNFGRRLLQRLNLNRLLIFITMLFSV